MGPARWVRSVMVLALMALAASCGDDREPMWLDLDKFIQDLDSLEEQTRGHGAAVAAGPVERTAMTAVERSFAATTRHRTDGMAARLDDMRTLCARADGREPELDALAAALDDVGRDVVVHVSSMALSSTASAARDEEQRYQTMAPARLAALRARVSEVAAVAAAYLCKLHN